MSRDINTTGVCHKCGKWFDMNHRCKCETGIEPDEVRRDVQRNCRVGAKWAQTEEQKMLYWHIQGVSQHMIAKNLNRKESAIEARLAQFGLAPFRFKDSGQQLRLPLLMDCGVCGRDISSCSCDYGV